MNNNNIWTRITTCLSANDRLVLLCLILCLIIIKFLFLVLSLFVELANSLILHFLLPNCSLPSLPAYNSDEVNSWGGEGVGEGERDMQFLLVISCTQILLVISCAVQMRHNGYRRLYEVPIEISAILLKRK